MSENSGVIYFGNTPIEERYLTDAWFDLRAEVMRRGVGFFHYKNPDGADGGWVAGDAKIGNGVTIEQGGLVWPEAIVPSGTIVKKGQNFGAPLNAMPT